MKTKFALGLLLLLATTSRTEAGTVNIRLEVSRPDGIAISTVEVGDTFLLRVYVQDLRAQDTGCL